MKRAAYFFIFLFTGFSAIGQEIPVITTASSEFIIKRLAIRPSLTNLANENPVAGKFKIREVDFDTSNELREINLNEMMAIEAGMRSRTVELDPPVSLPERKASSFYIGRNPNPGETPLLYNQSYSPELPGRGTRNTVYRDARVSTGATWLESYSPFLRRYGTGNNRFYY